MSEKKELPKFIKNPELNLTVKDSNNILPEDKKHSSHSDSSNPFHQAYTLSEPENNLKELEIKKSNLYSELNYTEQQINDIKTKFINTLVQKGEYLKKIETVIINQFRLKVDEFDRYTNDMNSYVSSILNTLDTLKRDLEEPTSDISLLDNLSTQLVNISEQLKLEIQSHLGSISRVAHSAANTQKLDSNYFLSSKTESIIEEINNTYVGIKDLYFQKTTILKSITDIDFKINQLSSSTSNSSV